MEVVKERVKASSRILEKSIKSSSETNVIVPDRNPDILKILHVDATCSIVKKILANGRLSFEGKIFADVIYLPESESAGIKTLPVVFEFNDILDCPDISEDVYANLSCEIEQLDINLINSRKITLRAVVITDVRLTADKELEYISELKSNNVAYKCEDINLYRILANDECEFLIKEQIDIPRSEASEILKCDVSVADKEVRLAGNKVIVKGSVCVTVLYSNCDGGIENIDSRFPFTEVFEVGDICDTDTIEAECTVVEKKCYPGNSAEGKCQVVNVELMIRVGITARRDESICCVSDCYCFGCETECNTNEVETERIVSLPGNVKSIREVITIDSRMPQISTVYNVVAKPQIISTEKNGDIVTANGKLEVSILYLSDNGENPICCHKAEIPIVHTFEATTPGEIEITAECEHISYNLASGGDVEIRAAVDVGVSNRICTKNKMITEVSEGEKNGKNEIVMFFAQGGESLWDVAKKYRADPAVVAELNRIDEGTLIEKGTRLIIPGM